MKVLALSGSAREASTNTAMLRAVATLAAPRHTVKVFAEIASLPVFSPDLETGPLPSPVHRLAGLIAASDALIVASPEYVRAIPGGLKNAIDWLVSRDELIGKPIALMHASHRGDDMLDQLRLVLGTVSSGFAPDVFARFDLMKRSPTAIWQHLDEPPQREQITAFLDALDRHRQG